MSQNMNLKNIVYEVYVGDLNNVDGFIVNFDGSARDLSNTSTYNTVKLHVWTPDGTLIINGVGAYSNRALGQVYYTLVSNDTVSTNAGNWMGRFITYDSTGAESDTSVIFNFNIVLVY